jgi:hypothetical protein
MRGHRWLRVVELMLFSAIVLFWAPRAGAPPGSSGAFRPESRVLSSTLGRPPTGESESSPRPGQPPADCLPTPKAVVAETDCDLGLIDLQGQCEHTFVVRNEGQAPLELRRGPTTCKCTMSDLPRRPIPPGSQAGIRLASKLANIEGSFSHGATVFTNDLSNNSIKLQIHGAVRRYLAAYPASITLPNVRSAESRCCRVTLYSQVWQGFEITGIDSSLRGLQCHAVPAPADVLERFSGSSGHCLEVSVPPDMPGGPFWEWLQVTVRPDGQSASTRQLKLDLTGQVATRFSLFGATVCPGKVIRLGAIRAGEGRQERVTLKVRDEHREVVVEHVQTEPEFLRARMVPCSPETTKLGLYRIEVEIPPDAPACNFMGERKAVIRIQTDHPHLRELKLSVEFAVI